MLEVNVQVIIMIAAIVGILAAVMLGAQAAAEHEEVNYIFVAVFGIIVAAALVGLWYDKTGISLSVYLFLIAIWLFLTRTKSPRIMAGMILVIPAAVLIYARFVQSGFKTAVVAAIITYVLAIISLSIATANYNRRKRTRTSNQRPAPGEYYSSGRNSSTRR